jgi:hypothetical protein
MTHKLSLFCLALVLGASWTGSALGADPKDALIGYWKLDGDTLDSSGRDNHGTAAGNPIFVQSKFEQAMYFDGNGDYLVIDSVADDFTNNDLTLSAWIKTEDKGTWQWWFSGNTASGGNVIILGLISGNIVVHQGAVVVTSTTVVNDLEWCHVAYTRIGSVGTLYINGLSEGTHAASFVLSANDLWSIAQEWDSASPGDFLNGTVDDVRIYDRGLTAEELPLIMTALPAGAASTPIPDDHATDVPRDVVLTWTPGKYAPAVNGHRVYLSESFDDVNGGIGGVPLSDNSYTPPQRLDLGATYYWRVDEVNASPDATVFPGEVWSFTVEPVGYALAGARISATASSSSSSQEGPANTIGDLGLNGDGLHSNAMHEMWLSGPAAGQSAWIQYEFDKVYSIYQMLVWNHNTPTEPLVGFGIKEAVVEYSIDGGNWTRLGDAREFARAAGAAGSPAETTVDFGGVAVRYVRITALSNWGGVLPQYGLSEVRFLYIPLSAREPQPASGATNVAPQFTPDWRAGRQAAVHKVYVGTDEQAVIGRTVPAVTPSKPGLETFILDLGQTYFWAVDEVNEAQAVGVWAGDLWSLSTQKSILVDDFEAYTDNDGEAIWQTWIDGYDVAANGAIVGNDSAPYAERALVHAGLQSMPLSYDNSGGAAYSEAQRSFDEPQDWTVYGISTLTVSFRGKAGNTGRLYLKINNTKVPYAGSANLATMIWQTWNIDLSQVAANLASVTKLTIGIEGANAMGTLYIDDIHLYRQGPVVTKPVEPDRANLVAHFALDGSVNDSSGNGHQGEAIGGPVYVSGVRGQAMEFDGADDCVRIKQHDALNPGNGDFTIVFWANLDLLAGTSGATNWDLAVTKRDTGSVGLYVGADRNQGSAAQAGYKFMLGSEKRVDTPFLLAPLGEWVYVAAVLDRANKVHRISVDGGQTWASSTPPVNPIVPAQDLALGWDIGPKNYWFHGTIDEVRLYKAALSDAGIAWLAGN